MAGIRAGMTKLEGHQAWEGGALQRKEHHRKGNTDILNTVGAL